MNQIQKELTERAVRATGVAPTKLITRPILFFCDVCEAPHEGVIVGWRCTEESGFVLTVEAGHDGAICNNREVPVEQIIAIALGED